MTDADWESDQGSDQFDKIKADITSALDQRSKSALSVLVYDHHYVFVNNIYLEDGKVGIEYDTFPEAEDSKQVEIEQYIRQELGV